MDPYHSDRGAQKPTFGPSFPRFHSHSVHFLKVLFQMTELLEGFVALLVLVGSTNTRLWPAACISFCMLCSLPNQNKSAFIVVCGDIAVHVIQ